MNSYYFGNIKERKGFITKKREMQESNCLASQLGSVNGIWTCELGLKYIKDPEITKLKPSDQNIVFNKILGCM